MLRARQECNIRFQLNCFASEMVKYFQIHSSHIALNMVLKLSMWLLNLQIIFIYSFIHSFKQYVFIEQLLFLQALSKTLGIQISFLPPRKTFTFSSQEGNSYTTSKKLAPECFWKFFQWPHQVSLRQRTSYHSLHYQCLIEYIVSKRSQGIFVKTWVNKQPQTW